MTRPKPFEPSPLTSSRADCVPEMRIEPERMHPTPVEEYSKMVMARNAMLAVQPAPPQRPPPALCPLT